MYEHQVSSVALDGPHAAGAPDAALVAELLAADAAELDDFALVEVVAAWKRVEAFAAARAAMAAADLSRRGSMNPHWPAAAGTVREHCVAGEELALRLGCSRRAARALVEAGVAFEGLLGQTGEALAAGEIDDRKARMFVRALAGVPGEVALAVQDDVLPRAGRRTHSQVRADIERALVRLDPDDAAERADRAAQERRVCRPTVLPNGMAGLWAVLPAPAAVALHGELDAMARRVRAAGDGRTLDQLRADALCAAVLARGDGGPSTPGEPETSPEGSGGDPLRDVAVGPPLGVHVQVTVPMDVLLGIADGAAELSGYGAIAPATAEALARGGTWRRLVTDPMSGAVLDVGRTRYRPPADLDRHVRTRDGTCVRPGCPTSAWTCELDHTTPFGDPADDVGGATAHDNLGALCKRDHLVKTHGGFRLQQVAPGVFEWTTPTGHRYAQVPEVFPETPTRTEGRMAGEVGAVPPPHESGPSEGSAPPDPPPRVPPAPPPL